MNDETPSEFSPPPERPNSYKGPPFWGMFVLGIGVLFLSGIACVMFQGSAPLFLGAAAAFVSLFFRGWRGVGVGYLAIVGLIILTVIVVCGTGIVPPFRE
jgi:hypothetical protein